MIHLQSIVSFKDRTQEVDLHANLPSVNNARDPAQDREANVNQEVRVTPSLEEDRERRL
jgi:hypothetical protein